MDWANERYVRLYTRDSVDWILLPWESRALFPLLVRKVDRAGVCSFGRHGARGLAALVHLPVEVVEPGLAGLLEDGCVELHGGTLVIPNFIEAQEASASDAQRARESRSRRRDVARAASEGLVSTVTNRDEMSRAVTRGHAGSQAVTLCLAVPSLAVPSQTETRGAARELPPPPPPPDHVAGPPPSNALGAPESFCPPEATHARPEDENASTGRVGDFHSNDDPGAERPVDPRPSGIRVLAAPPSAPSAPVSVALNAPVDDEVRGVWDTQTMNRPLLRPLEDVWASFCGQFPEFPSRRAMLGRWQRWVIDQARFDQSERVRNAARMPLVQGHNADGTVRKRRWKSGDEA